MALTPQGQARGGLGTESHPTRCPAPTHTLELRLINTRLLFHCESRGDQARRGTPRAGVSLSSCLHG